MARCALVIAPFDKAFPEAGCGGRRQLDDEKRLNEDPIGDVVDRKISDVREKQAGFRCNDGHHPPSELNLSPLADLQPRKNHKRNRTDDDFCIRKVVRDEPNRPEQDRNASQATVAGRQRKECVDRHKGEKKRHDDDIEQDAPQRANTSNSLEVTMSQFNRKGNIRSDRMACAKR